MITGSGSYTRPFDWVLSTVPGRAPLVVLLHGLRQSGQFCLEAWAILKNHVHLLAPDGPCVHEWNRPRRIRHAWYVYDGDREKLQCEMAITSRALDLLIADVSEKIDMTSLNLGGFSQGAYLALYYALAHNPAVNCVQAVAGNFNANLAFENLSGKTVLLDHGDQDPSCPVERIEELEKRLRLRGADVRRTPHACGHEFVAAMALSLAAELSIA